MSPWKKANLKVSRTEFCLDAIERDFDAAKGIAFK
jgi:hypothetical protein